MCGFVVLLTTMLLLLMICTDVLGLKNITITVPQAVRVGDTVTLSCNYDLEHVALYSIRWYRNLEEFYRFVPRENPPSKVFQMDHINVDINRSNSTQVTLTEVDRETSGSFQCEVSADAPFFHTEICAATLLVAQIPTDSPVVKADAYKTAQGTKIKATCTTPGAFPPMNVSWAINDIQINQGGPGVDLKTTNEVFDSLPGLIHVRSYLTLNSHLDLFKKGKLKLKCTARMFSLYQRTTEVEVQDSNPPTYALVMAAINADGSNNAVRKRKMGELDFLLFLLLILILTFNKMAMDQ